ncbi:MAG: DNA-3-methyladenine glycosylase [Bacteroidetes bacterium]|nr:DNA-3-methyladenine glycosylase [Bacteroidota bacterium]MBS1931084.1 DNA-3-methyladenine glycosylase [Bacteroidota bacterium]
MRKLPASFYERKNVLQVAKELLGKVLVTKWNGIVTSGRIVECEAYNGVADRASHAFGGRRTARNEVMYGNAGSAYVYLCYGIHHLFNVVTNKKEIPHAILIRALDPIEGIPEMLKRRKKKQFDYTVTKGPGSLSTALGITVAHNGISLQSKQLYIADDGFIPAIKMIGKSGRIGVEYSGEAAAYPYRFFIKSNSFVSGKKKMA